VSDTTADHSPKRTWVAVLLTILVPGLGHLYLRLWVRSVLWFALYFTTSSFLLPGKATPESLSIDAFVAASEAVPLQTALLVVSISLFCLLDVYMMSNYINYQHKKEESGVVCPSCGKELDEDLDFCHWCTTELDDEQ
jgi:hypothetical protein